MSSQDGLQEIISFILLWFLFAAFIEALVELLLTAGPLETPRAWLARKSGFIADLISCGYCFSVWVAATIAWILPSPMQLAIDFGISNIYLNFCEEYLWWFINTILLHRFSNIFHVRIANKKTFEIIEDDDG